MLILVGFLLIGLVILINSIFPQRAGRIVLRDGEFDVILLVLGLLCLLIGTIRALFQ